MKNVLIAVGCLMMLAGTLAVANDPAGGAEPGAVKADKPAGTQEARDYLKQAYPPAKEGMVRHVLFLDAQEDESLYQVELIVGKTIETDGVNSYSFMGGGIEEKDVKGWGFPMYVVPKDAFDRLASTLIGVRGDVKPVQKFVPLSGEGRPYMVRYNSKLPVVVYVPAGGEVKYRIWQTGAQVHEMAAE